MKVMVTGGAGFIGSAVVRHLLGATDHSVVNLDKLTYAASPDAIATVASSPNYAFERIDVCDGAAVAAALRRHTPDAVMHLAAETHVDRSIDGPPEFIRTNIVGTAELLEAVRAYWPTLSAAGRQAFRFHHVSTDEVYGSLGAEGMFTETTPYDPNSPYAASKAAADHLVRAWHRTYGIPAVLSNSCNNFGPFQYPEKLIPMITVKGLAGEPLPVYGDGRHCRDWLYVEDHARALVAVLERGRPGETYNVGAANERSNRQVVEKVCDILDQMDPLADGPRRRLITSVPDRPGHDRRYAIDATKVRRDLDWHPRHDFETALHDTVRWYADNRAWWEPLLRQREAGRRQGLAWAVTTNP
jgi:dTDP-glucose 4,6-dehydratase